MKKRIFVAGMHQESNSFSPIPTEYEDFRILRGNELLEKMAGIQILTDAGYDIVPSLYARAWPGGTVKLTAFQRLMEEILEQLPLDGSIDGVMLWLHGAMDVEFIGSGDALMLSMIRERVGPRVPISAALDLHANNTYTFARICNLMYGYRTAPHTDIDETRNQAARLLVRAMREKVLPWSEIVRLPFMTPGENMMTVSGIGREIIEALPEVEQASGVWCASYFSGMPWMDCAQNGAAVVISGVGDKAPGLKAAKKLADKVWSLRKDICFQGISMMPQEGLAYLDTSGEYPSILSDSADNVTAGSAGDNIYTLQMVLETKTRGVLIAGLIDAPAVQCCAAKKPGCILSQLSLGGTLDASGSRRMTVEAKVVRSFCDASGRPKWAVISVEGIDVLLFADREPVRSEAELRAYGLNPYAYRIIVVKQGYIYPDLQRMCKLHVMALTPGNSAQDLTLLHYHKIRWPMEPIEDVTDLSRIAEVYGD